MRLLAIALFAIMVTACSTPAKQITITDQYAIEHSLALNTPTTVQKGEVLYAETSPNTADGAILDIDVHRTTILTYHKVPAQSHLLKVIQAGKEYFCTQNKTMIDPLAGPMDFSSCFSDLDNNGTFDEIALVHSNYRMARYADIGQHYSLDNVPYRRDKITIRDELITTDIVFSGVEKGYLRLEHRWRNALGSQVHYQRSFFFPITEDPNNQLIARIPLPAFPGSSIPSNFMQTNNVTIVFINAKPDMVTFSIANTWGNWWVNRLPSVSGQFTTIPTIAAAPKSP